MRKNGKWLALTALLLLTALLAGCTPLDDGLWKSKTVFYRINQRQVGDYQDRQADWTYSTTARDVFSSLEAQEGAFICSTWNYDLVDGKRRYERSRDAAIPVEYDYYGKSMTVTKRYFDYNPVFDAKGVDVRGRLTNDARTIDILVPARCQKDAERLTQIYQEYMAFHNVEIANIYHEALGEPLSLLKPEDFAVNIIYVADGTDYAVYDPRIACDQLTDCIVIVINTENFCRVQLQALLTQGLYVCAPEGDAEARVRAVYAQHDYEAGLHSLQSVFAAYEEYRQEQTARVALIGALALLGTLLAAAGTLWLARKTQK